MQPLTKIHAILNHNSNRRAAERLAQVRQLLTPGRAAGVEHSSQWNKTQRLALG